MFNVVDGYTEYLVLFNGYYYIKPVFAESECEVLNQKITLLLAHLDEHPYVCITYFVPDLQKEGGKYETHSGSIKSWDEYEQRITFDDNTQVKANEIIDIKGELFDNRAF